MNVGSFHRGQNTASIQTNVIIQKTTSRNGSKQILFNQDIMSP